MIHAMTIDLEDYHSVASRDWLMRNIAPTSVVLDNTRRLLELFAEHDTRATFFTLGEVAEHYPQLIRAVSAAGHELGVHGYYHRQLFKLTPADFREEVTRAKKRIEDVSGEPVFGHRAPAFSIIPDTRWGLDVLAEAGFRYDSSIFPIAGKRYGWPGFRRDIHVVDLAANRRIVEFPLTTISLLGRQFPACGGGYLRHFPLAVTRWAIERTAAHQPAVVYLHPCEVEVDCGPMDTAHLNDDDARRAKRFHRLQLRNRHTVMPKMHALLKEFAFAPMIEVIACKLPDESWAAHESAHQTDPSA
jgi:polysaccharide deacetylase family protein (PEP-CTERM system associated)